MPTGILMRALPPRSARACLRLNAALVVAVASPNAAIGQATLSGIIVDSATRAPVSGAVVEIPELAARTAADSSGRYRLEGLRAGEYQLVVRAVSFRPDTSWIDFRENEARVRDVSLAAMITTLDEVRVAGERTEVPRKLAEFEERRAAGFGRFIDQQVIDANHHRRVADILNSSASGLTIVRGRASETWIATRRMATMMATDRSSSNSLCYLDVWIDGVIVYNGGAALDVPKFDINSIPTTTIAGIEVYNSPAQLPARFNKTGAPCGAIVVWTR
jgi:hypothetical protein